MNGIVFRCEPPPVNKFFLIVKGEMDEDGIQYVDAWRLSPHGEWMRTARESADE